MTDKESTEIFRNGATLSRDEFIDYIAECLKCNDISGTDLVSIAKDFFDMPVKYDGDDIFTVEGSDPEPFLDDWQRIVELRDGGHSVVICRAIDQQQGDDFSNGFDRKEQSKLTGLQRYRDSCCVNLLYDLDKFRALNKPLIFVRCHQVLPEHFAREYFNKRDAATAVIVFIVSPEQFKQLFEYGEVQKYHTIHLDKIEVPEVFQ
jgi:hypothetical protein